MAMIKNYGNGKSILPYNGTNITFDFSNGDVMVNLTDVAKAFPEKNLSTIVNSKEIKQYVERLAAIKNFIASDLLKVENGVGTWAHQKVALRVAQKLSPDFSIWVDTKLEELLTSGVATVSDDDETILHAMQVLQKRVEERQKALDEAKSKIVSDAPKVAFANAIITSNTSCLIGELAKLIAQNGVSIGQNRLFEWMRENGYIGKRGENRNIPNQKYIEQGLFELKKGVRSGNDGVIHTIITTKVTGKGQAYFINKFLSKN